MIPFQDVESDPKKYRKKIPVSTEIIVALIAGIVAVISAFISIYGQTRSAKIEHQLTKLRETEETAEQERKQVNLKYLNPLRLYLEECYFRLSEIGERMQKDEGKCHALLYVTEPQEVSDKTPEWFYGEGCYLVSSCYLTACLFYQFKKTKDETPYLKLSKSNDTTLINMILRVQQAFLHDFGVFYVVQSSIGHDIIVSGTNRLMSYREFCQFLQNSDQRVWFDRLIRFYIDFGKGKHNDRLEMAKISMQELSKFLDEAVGGGASICMRNATEE